MTTEFKIEKASRVGVVPLIDLYGESGTGKSMSALLLARGMAGPSGKIVAVDTESRRLSLYADVIPGGFDVINLDAPFSPSRYIAALQAAFDSHPAVVVVDSGSHEWEGTGGVTDQAAEIESKSGRPGLHNWKTPKFEHAKFVQFLLRSPVPVIVCIRAKYKTRQKKDEKGKTIIIKDEVTSPIQAEDFIFESTAHAEILQDHTIILTKVSHPELRKCFPADRQEPISIKHGEAIAAWCKNAGQPSAPKSEKPSNLAALKKELWNLTSKFHNNDKAALQQHLWDEGYMSDTESLDTLLEVRLSQIIEEIKTK